MRHPADFFQKIPRPPALPAFRLLVLIAFGFAALLRLTAAPADPAALRARAENGDPEAENSLGNLYNAGQGVKQDFAEAHKWYRLAADTGFAAAQFNLGLAYELGRGVAVDEKQAFGYYKQAAEQGYGPAQFNIGNMYAAGRGVERDFFEANVWYKQAADKGIVEACFNLGLVYEAGRGVLKDEAQAARWYKVAADRAYAPAQYNLGLLYEDGRGVLQNDATAAALYRAAADQGFGPAQNNLGLMYASGRGGLAADPVQAYAWLALAVENGVPSKGRDQVAQGLTPAQLEEARAGLVRLRAGPPSGTTASAPTAVASPVRPPVPAEAPAALSAEVADVLERAQAANNRLAEANRQLVIDKAQLEQKLGEVGSDKGQLIDQLRAQSSRLSEQVQKLIADKAEADQRAVLLAAQLKDLQQPTGKPGPAPAGAEAADTGALATRDSTIGNLRNDNQRLNDEVKRSTVQLLAMDQQIRRLQQQVGAAKPPDGEPAQVGATNSTVADARRADDLQKQLASLGAANKKLESDNADLDKWAKSLEKNLNERTAAAQADAAATGQLQQKLARIQQQLESQSAELARVQGDNQKLAEGKSGAEKSTVAAEELRRQLADVQAAKSKSDDRASTLRAELDSARRNLQEHETQITQLAADNRRLAAAAKAADEVGELKRKLDAAGQTLEKNTATIRTLTSAAVRSEKDLAAAKSQAEAAEALRNENVRLNKVVAQVDELQRQQAEARKGAEDAGSLRARIDQLTKENRRLVAGADDNHELEAARSRLAVLEKSATDADVLGKKLAAARAELEKAEAQAADWQRQLAGAQAAESIARSDLASAQQGLKDKDLRIAQLTGANQRQSASASTPDEAAALRGKLVDANAALDRNLAAVAELTGTNAQLEKALALAREQAGQSVTLSREVTRLRQAAEDTESLRADNLRLQKDAGGLRTQIEQLKADNQRLTAAAGDTHELDSAKARIVVLEQAAAAAAELPRQLAEAQAAQTKANDELARHRADLATVTQSLKEKIAQIADLEKQLEDARTVTVSTHPNVDDGAVRKLTADLAAANQASDRLSAQVADLTGANDKLEKDLETAKKSADAALAAQAQVASASQGDAYKLEIGTLQARVKELENAQEEERGNTAREITNLASQLEHAREANKSISEANRALLGAKQADDAPSRDEFDQAQAKVRDLTAAGDELRRQNQALVEASQKLTTERDAEKQQLADAQKDAAAQGASVAELTGVNQKLEQDRDALKQQASTLTEQLAAAQKSGAAASDQVAGERAALQERLETVGGQMLKTQQENDELRKQLAAASQAVQGNHDAMDKLQADLATAQARLDEEQKTAEAHGASVAELTAANEKLTTDLQDLRRQVESGRADLAQQTQLVQAAEQRRTDSDRSAQQNIDALTAQLAQVRHDLETARAAQARLADSGAAQDHDRLAVIAQLRNENAALGARLQQAQGTLDQIAATARLGTPAAQIASGNPPIPTVSTAQPPAPRFHTVAEGDSLSRISLRYYGTTSRWQDIYNANRELLQASNVLKIGMQLRIP